MAQHPSLLDTDRELLTLLNKESRQTPSMLFDQAQSTDSKQYVQDRLKHLRDNGLAQRPGRGIYELTECGKRAAANLDLYNDDRDAFWNHVR
ncbi:hypothetical protein ACFQJ7_12850 [Halovenus rubra]|uniref:Uncharacterized protein n=2 Tax=Halovenus rubra TaxID=869890 RepID=A0ACC7DZZ6_9EURY|nr:hypothetical protein [Halovenus rubra]